MVKPQMTYLYRLFFIVAFLCLHLFVKAQMPPGQYTSTNKKAIKFLNEGKLAFEKKDDRNAEKFFLRAFEEDPKFIEAALGLANLYQVTGKHDLAIEYYKKAIAINPRFYSYSYYFISESYLATAQY